ncbi:CPCC family cysteine-rich protein [Streptomyces sp. NPDC087270]|uniref:CPCC family cysteine-rich protein n=1 Tax=Streptomyces sp. NPDC087270 TaxID=3365774 RepID=UPI003808F1EE
MPESFEICPVCFWEDDGVQFRWPTLAGGATGLAHRGAAQVSGLRRLRPLHL